MTKDISQMTDVEFEKHLSKIKPILPIWAQEGNSVVYREQGYQKTRSGKRYHIKWVVWKDKKGKQHKDVHWIKWEK